MNTFTLRSTLILAGLHLAIVILCSVLLSSVIIQFTLGEYPCPLCMTQRISFLLCALGQYFILSRGAATGCISLRHISMGLGMTLLAATSGITMSIRQILLHIIPPDPGYGAVHFGLHLYTWAFIIFACQIIGTAVILLLAPRDEIAITHGWRKLTRILGFFLAAICLLLAVGTFIEEGLHWFLPDNPVKNQLLFDLQRF